MDSTTTEQGIKTLVQRHDKVEGQKDLLVELVEGFFTERQDRVGDAALPKEMTTQLQHLASRSGETKSVKEIVNFIRYQIGRDMKREKNWAMKDFGKELIDRIQKVGGLAGSDKEVAIQLVRLFLGYFQRHARYLEAQKPGNQAPQAPGRG